MTHEHIWQAVIGLEIHVELNTRSKLFSRALNRFGDEPNTNITEVCTGQPGALPVLNQEAVRKACLIGLALGSKISKFSTFDRKSYFYPDSPRNFQITQFENPLIQGGSLSFLVEGEPKEVFIKEAHLEDDAGTLKHFSHFAGVDYNRAGVPLLEIVTEPCMHSAIEASCFTQALKTLLEHLEVAECNMEEGGMRFDINISLRALGEPGLRNRVEIKNMNSFTNMQSAIDAEIKRQAAAYLKDPEKDPKEVIRQTTCRFDPLLGKTVIMRSKEVADDYRYFPEPDLVPLILTDEYLDSLKKLLPELPAEKKRRYVQELGLAPYAADLLISNKKLASYFEEGLKHSASATSLCNWMTVEFQGRLKESGLSLISSGISAQSIATLVNMIDRGTITGKIAKSVADEMVINPSLDPETIVSQNPNYQPVSDEKTLEAFVNQVLKENPTSIADFRAGKERAFGFLVGQVMKLSQGKASPALVNSLLKKRLSFF